MATRWGRALATIVGLTCTLAFVAAPASASAQTLSNLHATGVQDESATLNGTASGFGAGSYCTFALAGIGGVQNVSPPFPAQSCSASTPIAYAIPISDQGHPVYLVPGQRYYYTAAHCAATQIQNGVTTCAPTNLYPSGFDQTAKCYPYDPNSSLPNCPSFTLGLPSGTTLAATNVGGTQATVHATVQIQDVPRNTVGVNFLYSTDPHMTGATQSPQVPLPATSNKGVYSITETLKNLTPGTTYYYRVLPGTSDSDEPPPQTANIESFQTAGFVRTDPATGVTGNAAFVNGEVDTAGASIDYQWLYSTSDATTNGVLSSDTTTVAGGSVPASSVQNISAKVSGLSSDTTYYFQLESTDGSIHGDVISFTTSAPCPSGTTAYSAKQLGSTDFFVTGCFSAGNGVYTGHGTVQINGVNFSAPSSATLTIDTASGTLKTNQGYDVDLGAVRLYAAGEGAISTTFTTSSGTSRFDIAGVDGSSTLIGLPLGGTLSLAASSDGTSSVEITALGLPSVFGGVTAEGVVGVGSDGSIQSVHAQLGDSTIGPLTLPGFTFDGDPTTDSWSGDTNLFFPLAKVGVAVTVGIKDARLNELGGAYSGPPEIPIDETGLEIGGIHFDSVFNPLTFSGGIDVDAGPKIDDISAFSIDSDFSAAFNQDQTITGVPGIADGTVLHDVPVTLGVSGTLSLLGFIHLASAQFAYYETPPSALITAQASLSQPLTVSCTGGNFGLVPAATVAGALDGSTFNITGTGSISLDLCDVPSISLASASAAISNVGMGVCGSFLGNSVGMGGKWPSSFSSLSDLVNNLTFYSSNCDLSSYIAPLSAAPRRHGSSGAAKVKLPSGLPFAVIRVTGQGAPPLLNVSGPNGFKIAMAGLNKLTVARAKYLAIPNAKDDTTYVELTRPARGSYVIQAQQGSAAIKKITFAQGHLPPLVRGRLATSSGHYVLSWHARPVPGQSIVFRDVGAGGYRAILTTSKAKGSVSFRPAAGVGGRSYINAYAYEGGLLRKVFRIATFTAPKIGVPGKPTHLTLRRKGKTLKVSWRPGARTDHSLVLVVTSDGRHRLFVTKSNQLSVSVLAKGRVRVTVTGVNVLGVRGASASSSLK